MQVLAFALAFLAGALVAIQIGSNTRLKEAAGEPLPALIISSSIGVVALAVALLVSREPWPPLAKLGAAPLSAWLGGLLGAGYAVVTVVLARHLGAATLVALVVTGQLVCSVLLDHFAVIGFEARPATFGRMAGGALLLGGVFLIWKF
ncbi:MAG TPA: DMT family transporter [Methylomirabilota bacterium]|nr:DMT family transporter [Methylomirabilota bacterium]